MRRACYAAGVSHRSADDTKKEPRQHYLRRGTEDNNDVRELSQNLNLTPSY